MFEDCVRRGRRRVALCGASDVAGIAILCAREFPVEIVGLVDRAYRETGESRFHGLPVERCLIEVGAVDAAMVTDMKNAQAVVEGLRAQLPEAPKRAPPARPSRLTADMVDRRFCAIVVDRGAERGVGKCSMNSSTLWWAVVGERPFEMRESFAHLTSFSWLPVRPRPSHLALALFAG